MRRAHAVDDPGERAHDELVGARHGQRADEVAVDLQVGERQVLEVLEGAEARPEVVERDRAAETLNASAERLRPAHVGDRGRLRELDDQPLGRHLLQRELALEQGERAPVASPTARRS